jgi:DNA-binding transcriptional ArsR family regulator
MSNKAITWAYGQHGIKSGTKFVLVALADMADQQHSCYPSKAQLSDMTELSQSVVDEHLKKLRATGHITVEERRRRDGGTGSNRYYLQLDGVETTPRVESTQGVETTHGHGVDSTQGSPVESTQGSKNPQKNPQENPSFSSAVAAETPGQKFSAPLCQVLVEAMRANDVKVPESISAKWLDAARLLVDRDGRDPHEARELIQWAAADEFWRGNILSLPKFREKYDQLRLQRARAAGTTSQRPTPMDHAAQVHEQLVAREAARLAAQQGTQTPKEIDN